MLYLLRTKHHLGRVIWLGALAHFGCQAFDDPLERESFDDTFDLTADGSFLSTGGSISGIGSGAGGTVNNDPDLDQLDTLTELSFMLDPSDPDTDDDGCKDFFEPDFPECNGNDLFTLTCLSQDAAVTVFVNPEATVSGEARFQLEPLATDDSHLGGGAGASSMATPVTLLSSADGAPLARQTSFDLKDDLRQLHLVAIADSKVVLDPDYQVSGERSHKLRVSLVTVSNNEVLANWNVYARRCD